MAPDIPVRSDSPTANQALIPLRHGSWRVTVDRCAASGNPQEAEEEVASDRPPTCATALDNRVRPPGVGAHARRYCQGGGLDLMMYTPVVPRVSAISSPPMYRILTSTPGSTSNRAYSLPSRRSPAMVSVQTPRPQLCITMHVVWPVVLLSTWSLTTPRDAIPRV